MPVPYARLLADPQLRGLAVGNLVSSVGDGMAVVAIPWLALELAHAQGISEGLAAVLHTVAASGRRAPGSFLVGLLQRLPQRAVLVGATAGWALAILATLTLAVTRTRATRRALAVR